MMYITKMWKCCISASLDQLYIQIHEVSQEFATVLVVLLQGTKRYISFGLSEIYAWCWWFNIDQ